jgi:hypothetical protein
VGAAAVTMPAGNGAQPSAKDTPLSVSNGAQLSTKCTQPSTKGTQPSASKDTPLSVSKGTQRSAKGTQPSALGKDAQLSAADTQAHIRNVEQYLNGIAYFSASFTQVVVYHKVNSGSQSKCQTSKGRFWLQSTFAPSSAKETDESTESQQHHDSDIQIRLDSNTHTIIVRKGVVQVKDLRTGKIANYNASRIPVLSVFNGKLNIAKSFNRFAVHYDKESHSIYVTLWINNSTSVVLLFALYPKNTNISALLGWCIREREYTTNVVFDTDSLKVNNKGAVPGDVFDFDYVVASTPHPPQRTGSSQRTASSQKTEVS